MSKIDYAREKALKILTDCTENSGYSNLALETGLKDVKLTVVDKGFISEIVYGTLRYLATIDAIISHFSKVKKNKISSYIKNILRMGIYQIVYMRVPASAACNESVKLAKRYGHTASAGFVNGILRNAAIKHGEVSLNSLGDKYSFPEWLVNKWIKRLGKDFTIELMEGLNQRPDICIRVNTLKVDIEDFERELEKEKVSFEKGRFLKEAYYIKGTSIDALESFKKGYFYVQDESSMICARVVAPEAYEKVLDICSAPGGKTSHMAAIMKNEGQITAGELHSHRILLLEENFKRLGVNNVKTKLLDATVLIPDFIETFDRVLCDVPCSGIGIVRKKPEIKWARNEKDINELKEIQFTILKNAARYVKPGGVLVYSTCTLLSEENEDITAKFLKDSEGEFTPSPLDEYLPDGIKRLKDNDTDKHQITLYPNINGIDGFYIARLKKRA